MRVQILAPMFAVLLASPHPVVAQDSRVSDVASSTRVAAVGIAPPPGPGVARHLIRPIQSADARLDSCLPTASRCTALADAASKPGIDPFGTIPTDGSRRNRVFRGALIGGLIGFVAIGLLGTLKEGICDAAKCPSAARYAILGTLGGAMLGGLAGAADW